MKRMDNCFDVLANYTAGSIERHSDSTDFEETLISPRLSAKGGKHSLLESTSTAQRKVSQITCTSTEQKQHMYPNLTIYDNIPVHDYDVTDSKYRKVYKKEPTAIRGREDNLLQQEIFHPKASESKPYFTNILKRSNNCTKQMLSTKDTTQDNLHNGKSFCPDCERRRIKKLNRSRRPYVVQPVFAVDNIHRGQLPFGHANDRAPLSQHTHKNTRKQNSNTSYELTSSESETGNRNERKHANHRRNFIDRFQKEMRKEYIKYENELIRSRVQQYPSKRAYTAPYNVFSTPYCQAVNAQIVGNPCGDQSKIPSTSSGFWEYLFEKIRGRRQTDKEDTKSCGCTGEGGGPQPQQTLQIEPCSPDNCEHFFGQPQRNTYTNPEPFPECKSCIQQTDMADIIGESTSKIPRVSGKQDKKIGRTPIICKCNSKKKNTGKQVPDRMKNPRKSLVPGPGLEESNTCKTCQEPHDDIAKTLEEKYNGEILCIHNPPCILINGCLNLPDTKRTPVQGNFWPVTQDKKSSFYHMCRKMKRPKNCEQACQYHPPTIDVQRAMQIKTEKLVQSICNHSPPCQVVYGCYKAKYDPKLDNSCVHVPMCQRLPQCLLEGRFDCETQAKEDTKEGKACEHKPKCNEIPLCSRKFVVLTAKGTVGTQVRPKMKLVCRHEPPCIMIPKCLARIIEDSYLPCDAIPDCIHQPCCELIPACCRKAAKEMVSVSSQYPNAPCRIV